MPNLTMTLEKSLLKKARKIAMDRNTSLTELIRQFLNKLVKGKDMSRQEAINKLEKLFAESSAKIGTITWKRDDLYDR